MVAQRRIGDVPPATELDADVALTGWDPYIVAITGGEHADLNGVSESGMSPATESRELRLMAWLREHGA